MPTAVKKARPRSKTKYPQRRSSKQGLGRRKSIGSKEDVKVKKSGTYRTTPGKSRSHSAKRHQDSSKAVRRGSGSYQTNGRTGKQPAKATKKSSLKKSGDKLLDITVGLRRTEEHMDLRRRPALLRERAAKGALGSSKRRRDHGPQSTLPSITTRQAVLNERPVRKKNLCRGGAYNLRSHSRISGTRLLRRSSDCCHSDCSIIN